jgi:hypothetical protein
MQITQQLPSAVDATIASRKGYARDFFIEGLRRR